MKQVGDILAGAGFGHYKLPKRTLPKFLMYLVGPLMAGWSWSYISNNVGHHLSFDCTPAQEDLGVQFEKHPMAKSLPEMAQWLLDLGAAKTVDLPSKQ